MEQPARTSLASACTSVSSDQHHLLSTALWHSLPDSFGMITCKRFRVGFGVHTRPGANAEEDSEDTHPKYHATYVVSHLTQKRPSRPTRTWLVPTRGLTIAQVRYTHHCHLPPLRRQDEYTPAPLHPRQLQPARSRSCASSSTCRVALACQPRAGILLYLHKIPEDFIGSDKRKRGWAGGFYPIYEISGAVLHAIQPFIKYCNFGASGFIKTDKMPWRKEPALCQPLWAREEGAHPVTGPFPSRRI